MKMKEVKEEWIEEQYITDNEMTLAAERRPTAPTLRPVSPRPVLYQTLTGISLPRVPQS
ncbi:hypothetical protein DPMN_096288 [Dreissena polymorpha]|uniref:Uncharacterized protein n=1 Tax=Dreissena polymorpha TaxID=45954 RepID=A0A9D4R3I7_DREPO|nr:hypothetical protein DPMN_096288 [Dreissena polymorpha]